MDNNELNVQLKAYKRRANLIFFLASFILSILITATFYFVFYHNYTVINDTILPVSFNLIEAVLLGIFLFEYVVQRHKVGTIVIGCTYFSFCRNALFQRILRLVFIFQRISEQIKNIKTVSMQYSARTVPQKKLL